MVIAGMGFALPLAVKPVIPDAGLATPFQEYVAPDTFEVRLIAVEDVPAQIACVDWDGVTVATG